MMPSYNNRLRYLIPLHRKSETNRRGHKEIVRAKQARILARKVKTRVIGSSVPCWGRKARLRYAEVCRIRNLARKTRAKQLYDS